MRALFEINGVVEAVFTSSLRDLETLEWRNVENLGFASTSYSPFELDLAVTSLLGIDPGTVDYFTHFSKNLSEWDCRVVEEASQTAYEYKNLWGE